MPGRALILLAVLSLLGASGPRLRRQPVTTSDLVARRLLYPVQEAADLLGVHRTTLYARHREGLIELVRIGGRTYVSADEIERYIRAAHPVDQGA